MNKIYKIIISMMILCIVLTGCSNTKVENNPKNGVQVASVTQLSNENTNSKTYKYFAIPDKIIFNNHGKEKVIENGSDLFNKILDLTDKRFSNNISFYKLVTEIEALNNMKQNELVLEFIYSDIKETEYEGYSNISRKYKRLIMPLTGKVSNYLYFDDGKKYCYGPIGTLSPSNDLVNILK